MDRAFGQSHDPGGDLAGTLIAHEPKRPWQHHRAVRVQNDGAALLRRLVAWSDRGYQIQSWKGAAGILCLPHFGQRQKKGQHRFGPLVFVAPVRMQSPGSRVPARGHSNPETSRTRFAPARTTKGRMSHDMLPGKPKWWHAPRWAADRSPRVRRYADRIRCCRWAAVSRAATSKRPQASATPLSPGCARFSWPVARPLTIRACGSLALSYVSPSSNQVQPGPATWSKMFINRPVNSRRTSIAWRSPFLRRRYS